MSSSISSAISSSKPGTPPITSKESLRSARNGPLGSTDDEPSGQQALRGLEVMPALPPSAIVAVIGAGTMGAGIAQVAAQAGHRVLLHDAAAGAVERGIAGLRAGFDKLIERKRIDAASRDKVLARLETAQRLEDLAPAALVIEAIIEDLEVKRQLFARLEPLVAADAIFATNTSSLSITAIAGGLRSPRRVVG